MVPAVVSLVQLQYDSNLLTIYFAFPLSKWWTTLLFAHGSFIAPWPSTEIAMCLRATLQVRVDPASLGQSCFLTGLLHTLRRTL